MEHAAAIAQILRVISGLLIGLIRFNLLDALLAQAGDRSCSLCGDS